MGFLVDDLLDFAQINAGKFRKVNTEFDLREAIEEIVSIQHEKALM
jgi:signal transduction histidine kinase